jgi:hypothetical protein
MKMKKINCLLYPFFVLLILTIISAGNLLSAKTKPYNLIKFGVKGYAGIIDTCYLNSLGMEWTYKVIEESNLELLVEPITLPFNIQYGYEPFLIIRPIPFLQVGVKVDYLISGVAAMVMNTTINQNYLLNINIKSYNPCVFANLSLGNLELGGGLFKSYTNIGFKDDFYGYQDKWYGSSAGWEFNAAFSSSKERLIGFTFGVRYRDLFISEFKDQLNRDVTFSKTNDKFSLDLSGFTIETGIFIQLIKLGRHKNEN